MQVGSPIFGEPGKKWNSTVCDNLDNGNYNEIQDYVQKVGKISMQTMFKTTIFYNTFKNISTEPSFSFVFIDVFGHPYGHNDCQSSTANHIFTLCWTMVRQIWKTESDHSTPDRVYCIQHLVPDQCIVFWRISRGVPDAWSVSILARGLHVLVYGLLLPHRRPFFQIN